MKKTMTILLVAFLLSSGCATIRKSAIDLSIENVKNAETIREVSTNCLSVWPIQSGFIKGALGSRINELPNEVTDAIIELDRLAELPEQSDYELGLFLGLKVRLLGSVSQKAIEKYAPNIIEYMQLAF
ncbi:hypothetical protein LCGC14_0346400 [marine sediment metagenome]|uniref:Lipoprotein n=1 Tax=marine sediment metagenome TaxID=412755 RepID=A0A0F9WK71_9ZZZZ